MTIALLIALGTFLLVFVLVAVPYYALVLRPETTVQQSLRQRMQPAGSRISVVVESGGVLKENQPLSAIGPFNRILVAVGGRLVKALTDLIAQTNAKFTAGQVILASGCLVLLVLLLIVGRTGSWSVGMALGIAAGCLPYVGLRIMRRRRLNKFEEHFPEAIDLIARTLRAGHAFTTGLRIAAEEMPEPVSAEFRVLHDQQNYGLPLNDGLRALATRVPIVDAKFFVTAVLTQRETGGNLAEILDNLATVIRERFRVKRQLRVLSARGRMTGLILGALPPCLGLFLFIQTPEHFLVLFRDPLGIQMLIGAGVMQVVGAFLIHKITNVEY